MSEVTQIESSGELAQRLETEGVAVEHPSTAKISSRAELRKSEDTSLESSEAPYFVVKSNSDSLKQMIGLLSETSQPMLTIDKILFTSSLLSKLTWGTALFGAVLVIYQNLIYTPDGLSMMAPMGWIQVILITLGIALTAITLDLHVNKGLWNSFFSEKKTSSFPVLLTLAFVGLVLWFAGLLFSVKQLGDTVNTGFLFVQTAEVADGLAQIAADQVLALLPLVIYIVGSLVGITYFVQANIGVHLIGKNSVKTGNFAEVMSSKYIKVTSQD